MQTSMAITALFMGVVGGPHCVAMCGAACAGISRGAGERSTQALWTFQLSRMVGYALFGAFAAGSVQGLAWLGTNTAVIRPVWTSFHVAALLLGVTLLWRARQPAWIETMGQNIWRKARPVLMSMGQRAPVVLGVAWALMPCGLLYSALLVASLSANALEGAAIMALFSIGTSISLTAAPWLLLRLNGARSGAWGIRLAGLALAATSGWALWMGITQPTGLWCL
ncbi:sulfite exporter TauE/SafE family protein [Hydrogenophaga sp. PBL-H3]|uniref:sulfite exporter TauE/SafE family protein n=1 Tax=Hydrogenophaga sp. PBL-H3 TaxID=434010 RepID=UPI0013204486|nr:sulfite exporter TauE/SafE family protein [Hydrogenophaga sp. PBL-H3]QHE76791.1 sulfite exporter TauE/SafE family protein [Hydrogenophaga sp. PBL-H3]QHE81215.1 sulfite exporter TauE/SafE family protein [Hydrogenophaga sp. PBL-H3]